MPGAAPSPIADWDGASGAGAAATREAAAAGVSRRRSAQTTHGAAEVCTTEKESSRVEASTRSQSWFAWIGGIPVGRRRQECTVRTTPASGTAGSSPQAKHISWGGGGESSNNSAGSSRRLRGSDNGLQQNSSKDDHSTAHSSRRTSSGVDSSSHGHENASGIDAGSSSTSGYRDASESSSSNRSHRWVRWCWIQRASEQEQQQEGGSLLSRLLRRGTVVKRETESSVDMRSGRPTFERRRRRYRTVSWKYKKSIGSLASFVFLCNQILAPGLTSMPLTLIEYGWLPSLLVNVLFCVLSSLCSLVLLRSVTLIEGNHNFDERFEYSATLRHFLAPPATEIPAGAAAGRSTVAQSAASTAKAVAETPGQAAAASAGTAAASPSAAAPHSNAIRRPFRLFRAVWRSFTAHGSAHRGCPVCGDAAGFAAISRVVAGEAVLASNRPAKQSPTGGRTSAGGAVRRGRGGSPVTSCVSTYLATASHSLLGFGRFSRSRAMNTEEEGLLGRDSSTRSAAGSSSGSKGSEDGESIPISHPRSDSTSTRHTDYSQSVSTRSGGEIASVLHVDSCTQAVRGGLPNFLLRRALYSLRRLTDSQQAQQTQEPQQTALAPQQVTREETELQERTSTRDWDATAAGNEREQQEISEIAGGVDQPAAAEATSTTNVTAATLCETAASSAANSEKWHAKSDSRTGLKLSAVPRATPCSAAAAAANAENSNAQSAGEQYGRDLQQGHFLLSELCLWTWHCAHALLLSPLHVLRWLCSLPHRLLRYLHGAVVRPPPLLPSSFPRLLSWLLHLNTFLSTCSAALLVAYCIDCLLLRVFSCSLFIPLLPTHVSSGARLQQYGDGWMFYLAAVGHWVGAAVALLLQPLCAIASVATTLCGLLAALRAPLTATAAAVASGLGNGVASLASAAAALSWMYEQGRQVGGTLLLEGARFFAWCDFTAVQQMSERLSDMLLPAVSSVSAPLTAGFLQEQHIAAVYGVPRIPFLYVLPSQRQIEEVFSGVCNSSSNSCSAGQVSLAGKSSPFAAFVTASSPALRSDGVRAAFDVGGGSGAAWAGSGAMAAFGFRDSSFSSAAAAASPVQQCLPQCVSHMGISVGYIITAAICLRLAAADLQENAKLQLLSFGAIIAAVLEVSCSAALMLLFPATAAVALSETAAVNGVPDSATTAGILSVTAAAGRALPATAVAGFTDGPHSTFSAAGGGGGHAAGAPVCIAAGAGFSGREGSSRLACCTAEPSGLAAAFLPPTTPAASSPAIARSGRSACRGGLPTRVGAAAVAVVPVATNTQASHTGTDASTAARTERDEEARPESPWPSMIVRGSGMGALVSTFVDAYSYSNALPSWANEIKDNIPVTQTLFMSTSFACTIYFLFGVLCAAAFPAFSASTNVLAAMLPSCHSLVAASCICFFHIFALLPNIVTSQISRRYDLLNMAICLDKPSAFYVASTMPWMLYWLLTFTPVFAIPSQLLTLLSNVLLNFAAPALVYVYALHATAPPTAHVSTVADPVSFSIGGEAVTTRGIAAAPHPAAGPAAAETAAGTAEIRSHAYVVDDLTYQEDAMAYRRQEQEKQGEAGAVVHNRNWQQKELDMDACVATGHSPSVRVKSSATSGTKSSSVVASTLSRASFLTNDAVMVLAPGAKQCHALPAPSPQRHISLFSRGNGLEARDRGEVQVHGVVCRDAEEQEHGASHSVKLAAGSSFIGRLTMHAVPEEEGNSEDEGHAAAVATARHEIEDDGESYSALPVSLSHLHHRQSHDSISLNNSGSVSRWSTSCFGDRRAKAARELGGPGGDDFLRTESSGFKRTQSQNVLSFQSRTLGLSESSAAAFDACRPGEGAAAKNSGGVSLQRGSTNVILGQEREAKTLGRSGGAVVTSTAGHKFSSKTEEKLGKMRVAGAVAGGGGARSREVQRQLQTWLEEYSRQMPESEVAQLLHRQQREEQQEEMRLQQREAEVKEDLRKKVENQWRRQHIFRADEETSLSPYGGGGSPARAVASVEPVPEQGRSASLPPSARAGDASTAGKDAEAGSTGVQPHQDNKGATGNPTPRRRSSRSLSFGRFLLPQQLVGPGDTRAVASAADNVSGTCAAAAEGAAAAAVVSPDAEGSASDLSATAAGCREEKQTAGTTGEEHQRTRASTGRGASARYADNVLAGEEEPARSQAEHSGDGVAVALEGEEVRRQQHYPPVNHQDEVGSGRLVLAGAHATERNAESDENRAQRNCDTRSEEDGSLLLSLNRRRNGSSILSSSTSSSSSADNGSDSRTDCVVSDVVPPAIRAAESVPKGFSEIAGHHAEAAQASACGQSGNDLPDESAVLLVDARPQEKHQVHQEGETQNDEAGAFQESPTFVRRTTKKCTRIDSVSLALEQRRRQQLLKKKQQQHGEQQDVQERHVEQQLLQKRQEEHAYHERQQQQREPQHHNEQPAHAEKRHQDETPVRSELDAPQPFERRSVRHATFVSRGHGHGGYNTKAVQSCSHPIDATGLVGASTDTATSAVVAKDKADTSAEDAREGDAPESEAARYGAGEKHNSSSGENKLNDSRSDCQDTHNEENTCPRNSISEGRTHNEVCSCVASRGSGLNSRTAAAPLLPAGGGGGVRCATVAIMRYNEGSSLDTDEPAEHSAQEDVEEQRQLLDTGVKREVLHCEVGEKDFGASQISETRSAQNARRAAARAGAEDSGGGPQRHSSSSKAEHGTSGVGHVSILDPLTADLPAGDAAASLIPQGVVVCENVEGESRSAGTDKQITGAVAEKDTRVCAAAARAIASGPAALLGLMDDVSHVLLHCWRVSDVLTELHSGCISFLRDVCHGIVNCWDALVPRLFCQRVARGAAESFSLTRQQQVTNKSQERVSFFPWLRSTEEQLVATYALLTVVLYCAAAALADEMWSTLEPVWFYFWSYSCRLVSLLCAVRWPFVLLPLLQVTTWLGATLSRGGAAAEYLLLLCRNSYVIECVSPWLNVSVKKMQRIAGWLGGVDNSTPGRPLQQAYGAEGDAGDAHTLLGALLETAQHQRKAFLSNGLATAAVEKEAAARLGQADSAQRLLNVHAVFLPTQTPFDVRGEGGGKVEESAGLSAETFFIGLLLLIACTLPLLRYTSAAKQGGRAAAGSRRQSARSHLQS